MMNDALLRGKSGLQRIVGLEVEDENVTLFIQNSDGSITSDIRPHRYWLLCSTNSDGSFVRLDGDLHYKWGKQYSSKSDMYAAKRTLSNKGRDVYTISNVEEACMVKDGYTFYGDLTPKDISILSFDIETTGLDGTAPDAKVLLISTSFRNHTGTLVNKLFSYDEYETEAEMLGAFFNYVIETDPSIITGHNIITFDMVYISDRCKHFGIDFNIGRGVRPVRFNNYQSNFRLDGTRSLEYKNVSVYGREIVDTYFLSVKWDIQKKIESYALKPMIKQLGMEKEGRQYYDAGSIRDHYKDPVEWEKIKQYAIADAEDAIKLWDYMGAAQFYWCQKVPKPFTELLLGATGSQINAIMVRAYLQDAHSIPKADEVQKYDGAISLGISGIYKNCIRWDVASLYPSIIIEYDVYDKDKDPKAYFLTLVKTLTKTRLENKRLAKQTGSKYYSDLEQSEKIGINSAYGFMGASGLNFNCLEAADFITAKGREILLKGINWATGMEDKKVLSLCNKDHKEEEL